MSAIVPTFEYDIFISYRHNDNLDGWVTDFVQNLEKELRSTLKDSLTIYFDKNPHDGLLETHNVDKSLEGKLRCLIFIPIISQTYCDTKSFAWRHEFCAFNKLAIEDQFGRDIRLSNGNVASRILPIKIHELDAEDKSTIENEIGGVLRAIEFIFKTSGVNRPLTSTDKKEDNSNRTFYRDQINKTANAIKEIINAVKNPASQSPQATNNEQLKKRKWNNKKPVHISLGILLLIIVVYLFYQQRTGPNEQLNMLDKSIAVLPFVNMSNDPEQEYFSDGISEEILNLLANVPELKVIGRTSSFYFKGKNEDLRIIGDKLGAASILEGSVRKEGDRVRITAQLIRASDGVHLWSDTYDRKLENIFALQDEIAIAVLSQLKLKLLKKSTTSPSSTPTTEVYNLMLKGNYFVDQSKIPQAYETYTQALALDSANARIWSYIAFLKVLEGNSNFAKFQSNYAQARPMAEKAMQLDNSSAEAHRIKGVLQMWWDFDWINAEKEFETAIDLKPGYSDALRNLAQLHRILGNYEQGYKEIQESLRNNPLNVVSITTKGDILADMGRYEEAIVVLKSGMEFNKDVVNSRLVGVYLASGKFGLLKETFDRLPEDNKGAVAPMVLFALGLKDLAHQAELELLKLHQEKKISSYDVAVNYSFMKKKDLALDYLEKAVSEKYRMIFVKTHALLRPLHDEPRYRNILRQVNLPLD